MKLYEWDFAPNCRRVRMFLLEKGIEIPREECITPAIVLKNDFLDRYPMSIGGIQAIEINGIEIFLLLPDRILKVGAPDPVDRLVFRTQVGKLLLA